MKLWHIEVEDYSGIFSTKERALNYFYSIAKRCNWYIVEIKDNGEWIEVIYSYKDFEGFPYSSNDKFYITSYVLDEENYY